MPDSAVTRVDAGPRRVSRRVVVNAPAASVFALVADPNRHAELDGSGTVRARPVRGPQRLSPGSRFSVHMRMYGVPYSITSVVTAFEEDRLVEWRHPAGHRWRWEMTETRPGVTEVTETFDYSTSRAPRVLELLRMPAMNAKGIRSTLDALAARFA